MAGVFAVIPKLIGAATRSDLFATKQDAMFQAISLTQAAAALAWDENNTITADILRTQGDTAFGCDASTHIRIGGFLTPHGRHCSQEYNASRLGPDTGEDDFTHYDDLDDFSGSAIEVKNASGKRHYLLYPQVTYLDDSGTLFQESGESLTIDLSKASVSSHTTNIKKLHTKVAYAGSRGAERNITGFLYYSTNIGQFTLARRAW